MGLWRGRRRMVRDGVAVVRHSEQRKDGFPLWLDHPDIVLDNNLPRSGKDIDGSHHVARYRNQATKQRTDPEYIAGKLFQRHETARGEHEYAAYKLLKHSKYVSREPRRVVSRDGEFWLLTSWERCNLREYLRETSTENSTSGGGLKLEQAAWMLRELITAVESTHRGGVAVCDLALENILVTRALQLLIADFDKWENPNTVVPRPAGRLAYQPHERGCTAAQLDCYALGVIGLEFIYGPDWLWRQTDDNRMPLPAELHESPWVTDLPSGYAKAVSYLLLAPRAQESTEELLGYAHVALLQMGSQKAGAAQGSPASEPEPVSVRAPSPRPQLSPRREAIAGHVRRRVVPSSPRPAAKPTERESAAPQPLRTRSRLRRRIGTGAATVVSAAAIAQHEPARTGSRLRRRLGTGAAALVTVAGVGLLVVPDMSVFAGSSAPKRPAAGVTLAPSAGGVITEPATPTKFGGARRVNHGPTSAQKRAAGWLALCAYRRGTNGDVRHCQKNWKLSPRSELAAQVTCSNYHNPTVYTLYKTGRASHGAFAKVAHQGVAYTGSAGACSSWWSRWDRTDAQGEYAAGDIAFRQDRGTGIIAWTYPAQHVVAQAHGPAGSFSHVCQAWWFNG
jgi:serine/threonine protein kinase